MKQEELDIEFLPENINTKPLRFEMKLDTFRISSQSEIANFRQVVCSYFNIPDYRVFDFFDENGEKIEYQHVGRVLIKKVMEDVLAKEVKQQVKDCL